MACARPLNCQWAPQKIPAVGASKDTNLVTWLMGRVDWSFLTYLSSSSDPVGALVLFEPFELLSNR